MANPICDAARSGDQAHEEQQVDFIIRIVQKQRNLTVIRRLNITAQGSRFESSKPDLNELAALDILFVKNDMQSGASRWLSKCGVVYKCIT